MMTDYELKLDRKVRDLSSKERDILVADLQKTIDIDYKFNEKNSIEELQKHIDKTYDSHYSKEKFQAAEFIIDGGHGTGFCIGNILKYAHRYGKKNGYNRADLLKVLHYAIIMLNVHDKNHEKEKE